MKRGKYPAFFLKDKTQVLVRKKKKKKRRNLDSQTSSIFMFTIRKGNVIASIHHVQGLHKDFSLADQTLSHHRLHGMRETHHLQMQSKISLYLLSVSSEGINMQIAYMLIKEQINGYMNKMQDAAHRQLRAQRFDQRLVFSEVKRHLHSHEVTK